MESLINQKFYVNLYCNGGLYSFNGVLRKVEDDFYFFKADVYGDIIVNKRYIKTLQPIKNNED